MKRWMHEHSLSLLIGSVFVFLMSLSFYFAESFGEWAKDRVGGMGDDAFGALLIVLATKVAIERGKHPSAASK